MIEVEQIESKMMLNADAFKQMYTIDSPKILLVEPLYKITDTINRIVDNCYNRETWTILFKELVEEHINLVKSLFTEEHIIFEELNDLFVEMEWQLEEEPTVTKDYFLDQVLTVAAVLAAKILFYYLKNENLPVRYVDARDIIITDNAYGSGNILTALTLQNVELLHDLIQDHKIIIMPADIGSSTENYGVSLKNGTVKNYLQEL